ncbi:MAG TPA: hypothetical protein VFD77_05505 [Brumimicrobium sp.]|nr:hypothetical protein [Brumimicrobium sp.]
MFTPLAGLAAGLTFWETFITCSIGGYISATLFYFGSSYFMQLSVNRQAKRVRKAELKGKTIPVKRKFTKTNRRVIHYKQKIGRLFSYWAFPLFLSIPLGTVIVAKFYKHYKQTYPLILLFLTIDCFIITGGAYFIKDLVL